MFRMNNLSEISIVEAKLYHYLITDCQDPTNTEKFEFSIKPFKSDIDSNNEKIRFRSHIRIDALQKHKKANHDIYLDTHVEVIFSFGVSNIKLIKLDNGLQSIDSKLHLELVSIAYSTIRGLISGYTKGTLFHNAYLPIYDTIKLLPEIAK